MTLTVLLHYDYYSKSKEKIITIHFKTQYIPKNPYNYMGLIINPILN